MSGLAGKTAEKGSVEQEEVRVNERSQVHSSGSHDSILALQRTAGNHAVTDLLKRSSGKPLDGATREEMESKFGEDFRDVRVHDDPASETAAFAAGARAVTSGRDIVFGEGFYAPQSSDGKRLLAHELAHVLQQSRSPQKPASPVTAEHEARTVGAKVSGGESATVETSAGDGAQLDPMTDAERRRQNMENMLPPGLSASLDQVLTGNAPPTPEGPPAKLSPVENQEPGLAEDLRNRGIGPPAPPKAKPATPRVQTDEEKYPTVVRMKPQPAQEAQELSPEEERQMEDFKYQLGSDAVHLSRGEFTKKYGVSEAESESLSKYLSAQGYFPDNPEQLEMDYAGRTGTAENLARREMAGRIGALGQSTTTGGIAAAYAGAAGGTAEDMQNAGQLGNVVEGLGTLAIGGRGGSSRAENAAGPPSTAETQHGAPLELPPEQAASMEGNAPDLPGGVASEPAWAGGSEAPLRRAALPDEGVIHLDFGPQGTEQAPEVSESPEAGVDPATGEKLYTPAQQASEQVEQSSASSVESPSPLSEERTEASAPEAGVDPATGEKLYTPAQQDASQSVAEERTTSEGPTIAQFGQDEVDELSAMWQEKLAAETDPNRAREIKGFIRTLENRGRPGGEKVFKKGYQAEKEAAHIYSLIGGKGETEFQIEGAGGEKQTTKPDLDAPNVRGEVKNWEMIHFQSESTAENMLDNLTKQVEARRNITPFKDQTVILDLRGQKLTEAQLQKIGKTFSERTGLPPKNIQIVTWAK
jgi:hypothetical protein